MQPHSALPGDLVYRGKRLAAQTQEAMEALHEGMARKQNVQHESKPKLDLQSSAHL